ncbi:hypothetical protein C9374_000480 [Naegleria lovaniensis]|uniref:Bacterial type II secretion system protein E domain-containing protein n=1 Tax=Naegleria lovaniensis TaxID=51637 RepID=A0AA88KP60_NAELO|nr:uncharacterized protein C9374_000480 [Naegleria lovaniensis]KAG2388316.1 hypothetical protein C9374_000480 [Naegleria lovaniensis]
MPSTNESKSNERRQTTERRLHSLLSHLQLLGMTSPFFRHASNAVQYATNDSNNNRNVTSPNTPQSKSRIPETKSSSSRKQEGKIIFNSSLNTQDANKPNSLENLYRNLRPHAFQSSQTAPPNNREEQLNKTLQQMAVQSTKSRIGGSDVLLQFSPLVTGQVRHSQVTYISPHSASESADSTSLQAGVLLVASTRADVRRAFIERLCQAAVERSALVYSIATQGGVNVSTDGVYKLSTHPTLSRRAILNALLRHGAHLLVFGTISTRDDVMSLMDAAYTGYHCVAEIYGESAHDVLSRLEAIGVDVSMLPQNLRIVVPAIPSTTVAAGSTTSPEQSNG